MMDNLPSLISFHDQIHNVDRGSLWTKRVANVLLMCVCVILPYDILSYILQRTGIPGPIILGFFILSTVVFLPVLTVYIMMHLFTLWFYLGYVLTGTIYTSSKCMVTLYILYLLSVPVRFMYPYWVRVNSPT